MRSFFELRGRAQAQEVMVPFGVTAALLKNEESSKVPVCPCKVNLSQFHKRARVHQGKHLDDQLVVRRKRDKSLASPQSGVCLS